MTDDTRRASTRLRGHYWDLPLVGAILSPFGVVYGQILRRRREDYRRDSKKSVRFPFPVIAIGNLTVGGTGKTPTVAAVLELLPDRLSPALVVSRGYGAQVTVGGVALNDEGQMLRARFPQHRFAQGADRATVIAHEEKSGGFRSIVLDDAYQHLRVARDLDILLVDASTLARPIRCLPAGPWREPISAARDAHVIVVTHVATPTKKNIAHAESILSRVASQTSIVHAHRVPRELRNLSGGTRPLADLAGRRVLLVSGIAAPQRFADLAISLGAEIVERRDFPDHHAYSAADAKSLRIGAREQKCDFILTTEKDLQKLSGLGIATFALTIDMEFLGEGRGILKDRVNSLASS